MQESRHVGALIEFDHSLFSKINLDWTNDALDWFFPRITDLHRDPVFFAVILPLLAFWIYRERKRALLWIFAAVISIGLSDLFSYRVIKASYQRERPQFTSIEVNLRTHHHSGPSFPSNHAANVFAAATSLTGSLPYIGPILFAVAAIVAYSRVYVGVHFPLDVMSGALIGTMIALLVRLAMRKWLVRSGADSSRARN